MKIIEREYNPLQDKATYTVLADAASEVTANLYPECAIGSTILCVATKDIFIKNTEGKWQKFGTTEVI
jgi:hypothetical protein